MKQIIMTLALLIGLQNSAFGSQTTRNSPPKVQTSKQAPSAATECLPCVKANELIAKILASGVKPNPGDETTIVRQSEFVGDASKALTVLIPQSAQRADYAEASLKMILAAMPYDVAGDIPDVNGDDFIKAYKHKSQVIAKKLDELVNKKVITAAQKKQILQYMGVLASVAYDEAAPEVAQ